MVFSSGTFAFIFLPAFFVLYFLPIKSLSYKNAIILIMSVIFYAWGEPVFLFIMLAMILIDWIAGLIIENCCDRLVLKKITLIMALAIHLGVLFIFKYLSFVSGELSKILPVHVYRIALPIGISFFTFQMMSYLIDVYRGDSLAQRNIFKLALYIMMFPQLIAGPIVRYSDIAAEIDNRVIEWKGIEEGTARFVIGLGKKAILADMLAIIVDSIYSATEYTSISCLAAWIASVCYTLQIYFDFSGYSDMAIGLAKIMGFNFKENFNYPYTAVSITDFWKKWHISLTDWFRDYVYIPIGGNRVKFSRNIINYCVVWLLTGIWHGANWTFILWGIIYLFCQLFERFILKNRHIPKFIGWFFSMIIVNANWVIFRSENISKAFQMLKTMFAPASFVIDEPTMFYFRNSIGLILIGAVLCYPWKKLILSKISVAKHNKVMVCAYDVLATIGYIGIFILSVLMILQENSSAFIYFNF